MKLLSLFLFGVLLSTSALANRTINAGPIWNQRHAQNICPQICSNSGMNWTGQWWTIVQGRMSVCQCKDRRRQSQMRKFVLRFNPNQVLRGEQKIFLKRELKRQHGINSQNLKLKRVKLVAKTKHGNGTASLMVGGFNSYPVQVQGNPYDFHTNEHFTFDKVQIQNQNKRGQGAWQIHLRGKFKVKKVVLFIKAKFNDHNDDFDDDFGNNDDDFNDRNDGPRRGGDRRGGERRGGNRSRN